jgi:hypothetical protein
MIEQPTRLIASVTPSFLLHGPENVINYPDIYFHYFRADSDFGRVLVLLSRQVVAPVSGGIISYLGR